MMKKALLLIVIASLLTAAGCASKVTRPEDEVQTCYYENQAFYCDITESCGDGICYPNIDSSCGVSQSVCSIYETCVNGICICKANEQFCSGLCCESGCIDPKSNPSHCGACGNACKPGQACVNGVCSSDCPDELQACESAETLECVDIASNWHHCGGCFQTCPVEDFRLHITYSDCIRGKCVPDCEYGWEDANHDISDGCESKVQGKCGNGIVEPGELCDGTRLSDHTCASILGLGSEGMLRCTPDCMRLITDDCSKPELCGNSVLDVGEVCDTQLFGDKTCASLVGEGSTGQLICAENCGKIDTLLCTPAKTCGNNVLDEGEVCDGSVPAGVTCGTVVGYGSIGTLACTSNCSGYDISECSNASVCGNGIREAGESCDGKDFGTSTCASLVGGGSSGQLNCTAQCEIDKSMCSAPSTCGNHIADGNDVCDGNDLKGRTCVSVVGTGSSGTLKCAANCANFDISECTAPSSCGNGIVDAGEACDGTRLSDETCATLVGSGSTGTLKCNASCSGFDTSACSPLTQCGNAKLDAGEVCDGTILNGKTCVNSVGTGSVGIVTCSADCSYLNLSGCSAATLCGNDKIDTEIGEVCDGSKLGDKTCSMILGRHAEGTLKCSSNCMFYDISDCKPVAYCGNGLIENHEICDLTSLAGRTCVSEVGEGSVGTLRCNSTCSGIDTSGCSAPQTCGNGALDPGEACDGVMLNGQTCGLQVGLGSEGTPRCNDTCTGFDNGTCTAADTCGNHELDAGEDCDDNVYKENVTTCAAYAPIYASGDLKCSSTCSIDTSECVKHQPAVCGNGMVEPGEACDGTNFESQTCQSALGMSYAAGTLKCSNDCKSILTDSCEFCGDGKIDQAVTEDCDGSEWLVTSCVDYDPKTYSGGILKCHPSTCLFDLSECTRIDASRECEEGSTRCTEEGLELCDSGKWTIFDACNAQTPICSTTAEQCIPSAWCNIQHVTKNADNTVIGYSRILKGSSWLENAEGLDDMLVAMICTSDLNLPVDQWPHTALASINTACADCGENIEFMTGGDRIKLPAGKHYCTFHYIFPDLSNYVCLPHKHGLSEPVLVIDGVTKLTETTSYIVYE